MSNSTVKYKISVIVSCNPHIHSSQWDKQTYYQCESVFVTARTQSKNVQPNIEISD